MQQLWSSARRPSHLISPAFASAAGDLVVWYTQGVVEVQDPDIPPIRPAEAPL
jgi:hypothetical protein